MKKHKVLIIPILLFASQIYSQSSDSIHVINKGLELAGPRLGLTVLTGSLAEDVKEELNVGSVITQFGWQYELVVFTLEGGYSLLSENVLLIGGAEQGVLLPSISWLFGLRGSSGYEFGLGPNLSLGGVGYVFAFGWAMQGKDINIPFNIALATGKGGVRISFLVGVTISK
ncbi:MAG: hypothetical protein K9J12_17000 [Melioribacteraceae bacterium]|nr:hypothetical protein [Melioribacteraceae bacterium]MCF8263436.1 hypothetical protein [Melioribacteraceae bacterium]MCF8414014.1 hypothetical protein [Melioribacteraceae bacterium]MCF8430434.1 hypothetical protein [Melioribacteraceae bacterium]